MAASTNFSTLLEFPDRPPQAFQALPTAPAQRIGDLINDWIADRRADGWRDRGIGAYAVAIEHFVEWAGNPAVDAVTEQTIKTFKRSEAAREMSSGTIRNRITCIRAFYDWAVQEGYVTTNPAAKIKNPRVTAPAPDPLSRAQIADLLNACMVRSKPNRGTDPRSRRAIYLMLYAGLRIWEVAELVWSDIDLERGFLTVRPEGGKGGKSRLVPIADELAAELHRAHATRPHYAVIEQWKYRNRMNGKKLGVKSLAHIFERWLPARGIHIHAHQLRKTFATELYLSTRDLLLVQRVLGHADPKTTLRYIGGSTLLDKDAVNVRFQGEG